jgi:hypothetical protein
MVVTIWFLLAHFSRGARGGRFDFFLDAREKLIFNPEYKPEGFFLSEPGL